MRRDISIVKLIMFITITLLLFLVGSISLYAFHSLTLVISSAQEKLYHERATNIYSILEQKYNRLQRTGLPEVYVEDFQKQVLDQIKVVYGNDKKVSIPFIAKLDGSVLVSQNSDAKIDSSFITLLKVANNGSFFYDYNGVKSWCHTLYFEPWQWYICYSVPLHVKYNERNRFFILYFPMVLLLSTLIILLVTFVVKKIMSPVIGLTKASAAIAGGDLSVDINLRGIGELGELANNFLSMRDAIRDKIAQLKEQELNLRTTLESIADCILVTDSEGFIKKVNSSTEALLDSNVSELLNQKIDNVLKFEDLQFENNAKLSDLIKIGHFFNFPTIAYLKLKNNKLVPISGNGSPMKNEHNEFVGMVIVFRDITKEKQLTEQLHQSQKMDAVGQLAGGVAHDFNNMLAGIIGASETLKEYCDTEDSLDCIEIIFKAANRASYLTKQLLAFSRKSENINRVVKLNEIVLETVNLLKRTIDKSIKVSIVDNAEHLEVLCDKNLLQNAFVNIGINASHAMPDGGELEFSLSNIKLEKEYCIVSPFNISPGEFIKVSISDTGCGMSTEVQRRIFEPFFTTKEKGKGTGLGLSAVYGIVQDHGGAITVYSEVGKGSAFHVYLPVTSKNVSIDENGNNEIPKGSGTILVIDDEELIRDTANLILSSLGYKVFLAENGVEGVNFFKANKDKIDMIILDMIMPIMGGKEAFNKIKEINPNVPVLIVSGFSKLDELNELENEGTVGFLNKPFRKAKLAEVVANILCDKDRQ